MKVTLPRSLTLTLALAAAPWLAGCDTSRPGAGFTNGPPPTADSVKPAVRTDLPVPEAEGIGQRAAEASAPGSINPGATQGLDTRSKGLAGSDIGGTGTEAGIGGRNAGRGGLDPAQPRGESGQAGEPDGDQPPEPRATPPTVEYPNSGPPGGTRPGGSIQSGTPRSPQL